MCYEGHRNVRLPAVFLEKNNGEMLKILDVCW